MYSGTGWNTNTIIKIINNGTIQGKAGIGSTNKGSSSNYCINYMDSNSNGGIGIYSLTKLEIINNGQINGGGGGGGSATIYGYSDGGTGGDAIKSTNNISIVNNGFIRAGGGGGGGQENWGGSDTCYNFGSSANLYNGGNGGNQSCYLSQNSYGGSGGSSGQNGSNVPAQSSRNYNCGHGAGVGGIAGKAINTPSLNLSGNTTSIYGQY